MSGHCWAHRRIISLAKITLLNTWFLLTFLGMLSGFNIFLPFYIFCTFKSVMDNSSIIYSEPHNVNDTMQKCIIHWTLYFAVLLEHAQCMSRMKICRLAANSDVASNLLKSQPGSFIYLFTHLSLLFRSVKTWLNCL